MAIHKVLLLASISGFIWNWAGAMENNSQNITKEMAEKEAPQSSILYLFNNTEYDIHTYEKIYMQRAFTSYKGQKLPYSLKAGTKGHIPRYSLLSIEKNNQEIGIYSFSCYLEDFLATFQKNTPYIKLFTSNVHNNQHKIFQLWKVHQQNGPEFDLEIMGMTPPSLQQLCYNVIKKNENLEMLQNLLLPKHSPQKEEQK